ncbi:MAG: HAD family hydrolase [Phycisphaeraceae bacterium]|nr:HAD family hydrolase [Phycisphaeraceae bacterium]
MNKIKSIIFDMDGVLIDAREWHYEALNQALELFGFTISRYDHLVTYDGLSTRQKLELLSRDSNLPRRLHCLINDLKQEYTQTKILLRCRPVFAHQYALSRLKAEGYHLAVASNSIRQTVDEMLGRAGLIEFLEFSLSNQDVKKPKPDPQIYITAIEKLRCQKDECLIVEDNERGIASAKASGAYVLEVADPNEVRYHSIINMIRQIEKDEA